ncbi:MAG TPA: hypothetical protein VFP40_08440 [Terriglobales bacterium]|jgi:hypothetical protein|nr:hypothetical protein [Terriglobales bacterium]
MKIEVEIDELLLERAKTVSGIDDMERLIKVSLEALLTMDAARRLAAEGNPAA